MDRDSTRVAPVALCPRCKHPGLELGETRTLEHGVELHLRCRGCGESLVLTIAETPHRSGDDRSATINATTVKPLATDPTAKQAMLDVLDEGYAHAQATVGVDVRFNRFVEPEEIGVRDADVVIVATGGVPDLDWIDGTEHCTSVWDVLGGAVRPGEKVIVYDGTGRHAALTAAEKIRLAGADVAFFGLDGHLAMEMAYSEQVIWRRRMYEIGIEPRLDRRLVHVERDGNRLRARFRNELTDAVESHEADQVVVEHGTRPADALFRGLRDRSANRGVVDEGALLQGRPQPAADGGGFQLFRIGDAVSSRATSTPPSSTRSGSAACCRWCVGARRCGAGSRSSTPRFASATSPVPGRASTAWDAAGRTCARPRWEATPPVRGCSRARRAAPDRVLPPPDPRRRAAP